MVFSPGTDGHRSIRKEIAQLRIYSDAKRWMKTGAILAQGTVFRPAVPTSIGTANQLDILGHGSHRVLDLAILTLI